MQVSVQSWDWPGGVPRCTIRAAGSMDLKVDFRKPLGDLWASFPHISLFPCLVEDWLAERSICPAYTTKQLGGIEGYRWCRSHSGASSCGQGCPYLEQQAQVHTEEGKSTWALSQKISWRTPGTGEPGRLPSMGSHRVGHDWSNLAAAAAAGSQEGHIQL